MSTRTRGHITRTAGIITATCAVIASMMIFPAFSMAESNDSDTATKPGPKVSVTLCHGSSSVENPYNQITVSANSINDLVDDINRGHGKETGAIFNPATMHNGDHWGDIIPAFGGSSNEDASVEHTQGYGGLNIPAGQSILDNRCNMPKPPPVPASGTVTVDLVAPLCVYTGRNFYTTGSESVSQTEPWSVPDGTDQAAIDAAKAAATTKATGIANSTMVTTLTSHATAAPNDIIPVFGDYTGYNLGEGGQAIFDNGCVVPPTPPKYEGTVTVTVTAPLCSVSSEGIAKGSESVTETKKWKVKKGSDQSVIDAAIAHATADATAEANEKMMGILTGRETTYPNDIVPVFGEYAGFNLGDGGQAIFDNGCVVPTPEPTPTPTPEPTTPPVVPGGPTPVIDYCPDVAGVQWEGYDCLTGIAPAPIVVPTETPVPVDIVPEPGTIVVDEPPGPVPPVTPTITPEKGTVVTTTIPKGVPAGDGSSAPTGVPPVALALLAVGALGLLGSATRLAATHK